MSLYNFKNNIIPSGYNLPIA